MKRIEEFETLCGILALWAVIGHVFKYSGYIPHDRGYIRPLAEPDLSVDVFMMLSGFVIVVSL